MITILHVISDTNFAGAGNYLKTLCLEMDLNAFDIHIAIPYNSALKEHLSSYHLHEIEGLADKSFDIKAVRSLMGLMSSLHPQVVHTHGALSGRIAARLVGVQNVFFTKHTLSPPRNKVIQLAKLILNRLLKTKAIAISKAVHDNLLQEGFKPSNIHLIYNGIKCPEHLDLIEEHPCVVISMIGRMEPIKGHFHFISILKKLLEEGLSFKVIMAGTGSLESSLKEAVQAAGLPVTFIGFTRDLPALYQQSDIIVNTSDSEALCYVALEGMSYQKPIVAFDLPGINEVIVHEKTGFLVPYLDYDTFAQKLKTLIVNPTLRYQMGEMGFYRVKTHFSVEDMAKKIQNCYRGDTYETKDSI